MEPLSQVPCRSTRWLISITAIVSVTFVAVPAAQGSFPGRNGRIAVDFSRWGCLATMKPDGSAVRTLKACDEVRLAAPDWSPDGARLLGLHRDGIAVMAADGSRQRIVPLAERDDDAGPDDPSFAPDGRHFAYTRHPLSSGFPHTEIWRATISGRGDRFLRRGLLPRWSPDGKTIAYVDDKRVIDCSLPGGGSRTWLMNARTGKRVRTIGPGATSMDWSPDARRLVYTSFDCFDEPEVFIAHVKGKGSPRRLTTTKRWRESEPVWSPDGRRVAFVRTQEGGGLSERVAIWTMNSGGGEKQRIWSSGWLFVDPDEDDSLVVELSWQPRGE
jgi:Tol biopolymer transport system component